jgi:hypothetical protein
VRLPEVSSASIVIRIAAPAAENTGLELPKMLPLFLPPEVVSFVAEILQ